MDFMGKEVKELCELGELLGTVPCRATSPTPLPNKGVKGPQGGGLLHDQSHRHNKHSGET